MTLQFFLDPSERHGLGSLVIDALLNCLDGAPTIGAAGKTSSGLVAADYQGAGGWQIGTQVGFIDVLVTNPDLGIAIVLENKIGHQLNNPLDRYAHFASSLGDFSTVVVAVLAPEHRCAAVEMDAWLSRSITYTELAEAIKRTPALVDYLPSPSDQDQRRSLELQQQFIEARSGDPDVSDLTAEAVKLDEWRNLVESHRDAIAKFEEARRSIGHMLRARSRRLADPLTERITEAGLKFSWETHGNDPRSTECWNAYCFSPEDWSIELKLTSAPALPAVFVFDYRGRTYKDTRIAPLGLDWTATDEQMADAFVERVMTILEEVRRGTM